MSKRTEEQKRKNAEAASRYRQNRGPLSEEDKAKRREEGRRWRAANPVTPEEKARRAESQRLRRQKNVEQHRQKEAKYAREYRAKHHAEHNEKRRQHYAENAAKILEANRLWRQSHRETVLRLLNQNYDSKTEDRRAHARGKYWDDIVAARRKSARKRGIEWKLTDEEALWFLTLPCHYCGAPPAPFGGIDRIDSNGVYDIGNIVESCKSCNVAKCTMSYEEFTEYLDRLSAFHSARSGMRIVEEDKSEDATE